MKILSDTTTPTNSIEGFGNIHFAHVAIDHSLTAA